MFIPPQTESDINSKVFETIVVFSIDAFKCNSRVYGVLIFVTPNSRHFVGGIPCFMFFSYLKIG